MKRILPAAPAALCLLYSALLLWSFFGNRELEQGILATARGIPSPEAAVPGIDSLRKLETLRQTLANLTKWTDSAPLRLSFGLYKGNDIRDDVRKIYYAKFRQLLFESAQEQTLADLQRSTPPYDALKSYLLTTSEWKRTSDPGLQSFLGSQLDARWAGGRESEIGKDRLAFAKAQFDYYASDLHNGNPYPAVADQDAVRKARSSLSQPLSPFSGEQHEGEAWVLGQDQRGMPSGSLR